MEAPSRPSSPVPLDAAASTVFVVFVVSVVPRRRRRRRYRRDIEAGRRPPGGNFRRRAMPSSRGGRHVGNVAPSYIEIYGVGGGGRYDYDE